MGRWGTRGKKRGQLGAVASHELRGLAGTWSYERNNFLGKSEAHLPKKLCSEYTTLELYAN
jgi:hypothetical protein